MHVLNPAPLLTYDQNRRIMSWATGETNARLASCPDKADAEVRVVKISITATGDTVDAQVDPRFGRARFIIIHDTESGTTEAVANETNMTAQQGAGVQTAKRIIQSGARAVISGHVGPRAFRALASQGIAVYLSESTTVKEAIERLKRGELKAAEGADVDGHW